MPESDRNLSPAPGDDLKKVVAYMRSHWPSPVKPEWQVSLEEYPKILEAVVADFTLAATKNHRFIRIAGLSGSGKTTQILPAVEAYCEKNSHEPILIAARRFVEYHPHYEEIKNFYGAENLRKNTDEFSTIMLFLTLAELTKGGYDIVLDVTLLDPEMEKILLGFLAANNYDYLILMIATSPAVTEKFLSGRAWRHSRETELEFIRATKKALEFYAENSPTTRIILWSVYDLDPVYDGAVRDCLLTFEKYSAREDPPRPNDDERRDAKIEYLTRENF